MNDTIALVFIILFFIIFLISLIFNFWWDRKALSDCNYEVYKEWVINYCKERKSPVRCQIKYDDAVLAYNKGNYEKALLNFMYLYGYKDSLKYIYLSSKKLYKETNMEDNIDD